MRSPRCGVADKLNDPSDSLVRFQTYGPFTSVPYLDVQIIGLRRLEYKWLENKLTYKISKYPKGWRSKDVDETMAKAFKLWSQASDLTFERMNAGPVDVDVR